MEEGGDKVYSVLMHAAAAAADVDVTNACLLVGWLPRYASRLAQS